MKLYTFRPLNDCSCKNVRIINRTNQVNSMILTIHSFNFMIVTTMKSINENNSIKRSKIV